MPSMQFRQLAGPNVYGGSIRLGGKLAVALVVCLAVRLLGQAPAASPVREEVDAHGYKYQVPLDKFTTAKNARLAEQQRRMEVHRALVGQASLSDPATRAAADEFLVQYFFPQWTTEEGVKNIGNERQWLLRELQAAKDGAARKYLLDTSLIALRKIVDDNYRPASRYNAMLTISLLNDVEATIGAQMTAPEPMAAALPFIVQQFEKPESPDPVRVAALLGMIRHIELENFKPTTSAPIPPALKTKIVDHFVTLAETVDPPEGRDAEVHTWLRRRAIEGLAAACLMTPDPKVVTVVENLIRDEEEPLPVRTAAAAALGRMSLQAPVKVDVAALAKDLGYLALVACDAELTGGLERRKRDLEREQRLAGNYSGDIGLGPGGMGEGGMMPGPRPLGGMGPMGGGIGSADGGVPRPAPGTRPGAAGLPGDEGAYGPGSGYVDPSSLDPKHYRTEYVRRRIRQYLYAIQLALTGGEDRTPPRPGAAPPPSTQTATPTGPRNQPAAEKRGLVAVATPAERPVVEDVYFKVRKLVEDVESPAEHADLAQIDKDMRKDMRALEAITRRLPPPGAVKASKTGDEVPGGAPPAAAGKGKADASKAKKGAPAGKTAPTGKATPKSAPAPKAPAPTAPKGPAKAPKAATSPPKAPIAKVQPR
jgi:hypothetical protein